MKDKKVQRLSLLAVLTALSLVFGLFLKIPTPTGFLTFLDVGIYFTAFYLGSKEGAAVGGLSAFLLDLTAGYPNWMLISLLAHGGQGYFAGWTGRKRCLGLVLASLTMVGLYFLFSILFYGLGASLAGIWGNVLQNFFGMLIGYLTCLTFKRLRRR
ncbi:ECF transporter S component [Streptococcus ratti]|uniref:ECF transporter S component n=1 Tax=Streptococcus ratti FA-1 = DSM 20564 TaxID=699248 RepID=A0ABP2QZK5_STRRT|nr:ECF transporter S component [Streptococcus ratti]EJN93206.1 hypothetical protein SRA_09963 [Streptococcus ratti FA-1 = DSM 20564]EMP70114.1 hypothetical protein D822_05347 [Streptococcus ratti FA-1 = DSM 20564]QEY06826.1 ECF transporter S component [Streptococcus ratti]VEI59239.1 membrane protein [Streptococcus mutans]